jgi:hypothetical protein
MSKILLRDAYCKELHKMPLVNFLNTKRIEMFDDELSFTNAKSQIEKV